MSCENKQWNYLLCECLVSIGDPDTASTSKTTFFSYLADCMELVAVLDGDFSKCLKMMFAMKNSKISKSFVPGSRVLQLPSESSQF